MSSDGLPQFGQLYSSHLIVRLPLSLLNWLRLPLFLSPNQKRGSVYRHWKVHVSSCCSRFAVRAPRGTGFFFAPDQFAVAIPAGFEALPLGAKCLSEAYPTHGFLQLNVANAFNTVSCSSIFVILPWSRSFPLSALSTHFQLLSITPVASPVL